MNRKIRNLFKIFLPLIIGSLVSLIIKDKIDYTNLIKPPFAPPKILFPIIWSIIYLLLGISYYLICKKNKESKEIRIVYYLKLIINAFWSIIFFYFKLRLLACIWIILLDIIVLYMLILFKKQNKISAYLNIPYFIWILFATYLTVGIYILN